MSSILLLHGSAAGGYSWKPVVEGLRSAAPGSKVFAPDMLGYGKAPAPPDAYKLQEEITYLTEQVDAHAMGRMHLVAHSMGCMYGLHLRHALGARVERLTLIDPVVLVILGECGETAAYAEMQAQYDAFMGRMPDERAAIAGFMDHWGGPGTWDSLQARTQTVLTGMAAKVRLEMQEATRDRATLAHFAAAPCPTHILVGENTRLAPKAGARHLQRAFGATTEVVVGAGHLIPTTHPQAVVQAICRG